MFNEKDIVARLMAGEDAQKIADEMATMLNQANKTYAEQKAKDDAAQKAKALEDQKKKDLQKVLDQFVVWLNEYYNISDNIAEEITADATIELIDSVKEFSDALTDLHKAFEIHKPAGANPDDVIGAFLKNMGW